MKLILKKKEDKEKFHIIVTKRILTIGMKLIQNCLNNNQEKKLKVLGPYLNLKVKIILII